MGESLYLCSFFHFMKNTILFIQRCLWAYSFLGFSFLAEAQTDTLSRDTLSTWRTFTYDFNNIFGSIGHAYSRPAHWKGDDWATFGAVVGGTGLLYLVDEQTSEFFTDQSESIPKAIQDYGWYYGNPQNNYALTGTVYLTGLVTKNEKLRRTGVLMIASASAAGLLQQVSKRIVGRARPRSGKGKDYFSPLASDSDYYSFPSGHAVLAFTNAYAIGKQFKNPWVKGGIYVLGLVPPVTRLWAGAHWLTDVTLGIALSIATVETIDHYLDRKYSEKYQPNRPKKLVAWNLTFGVGKLGVVGTF